MIDTKNTVNKMLDEQLLSLTKGYTTSDGCHQCCVCNQKYEIGVIYQHNDVLYDATRQMEQHIEQMHGGMLAYYLQSNPELLGITLPQQEILQLFALGLPDKEIAKRQGIALSTIRNYRFKLREKEKQAKYFLAAMSLLEMNTNKSMHVIGDTTLVDIPTTASIRDERFNISEKEKALYTAKYFDENGALLEYPAKAKRKVIVLEVIAAQFKPEVIYHESEVNRILMRLFDDYVTLRRALIEYGFMDRNDDGSKYWVTL